MGDSDESTAAPLVFRGLLTEADVADMRWCHDRVLVRPSVQWLARGFAAVLAALLTAFMVAKGPNVFVILSVVACGYVVFVLPYERCWQARRHYRRHANDYLETEVRLTPDRVLIGNDDHCSEFAWRLVGLIAESESGLLFCNLGGQMLFWLPARLFDGNMQWARILDMAESNGVRVLYV